MAPRFVAPVVGLLMARLVAAASLADIDHVVLFMQENRSFDTYFGSMAGVRGFSDPNVQVTDSKAIWEQQYEPSAGTTGYLMPWYINYLGGDWDDATQCMLSGSNAWDANHNALNGGKNDRWAAENKPVSWGHYQERDLPVHCEYELPRTAFKQGVSLAL